MSERDQALDAELRLRSRLDETIGQVNPDAAASLKKADLTVRQSTKDVLEKSISENLSARGSVGHIYNTAGAALILMPFVGAPNLPAFLLSTGASAILGTIKPVVHHVGENFLNSISLALTAVQERAAVYDAHREIRLRATEAIERDLAIEAAEKYVAMSPRERARYNQEQRELRIISSEISRAFKGRNLAHISLYA